MITEIFVGLFVASITANVALAFKLISAVHDAGGSKDKYDKLVIQHEKLASEHEKLISDYTEATSKETDLEQM